MTTIATTYLVHDENLDALRKAIDHLTRRAAKLGLPAPTIALGETETTPTKDGRVTVRHHVTVSGEAPRIAGWSVQAMLDHAPGGVIIRKVGGDVPERYREAKRVCEHCHAKRDRVSTYVLAHEDGRLAQVGTSCLADFTGHDSPDMLAHLAEFLAEAREAAEDAGELGAGGGHSSATLASFMAYVSAAITRYGFLSRKVADERDLRSTATTAIAWLMKGAVGRLAPVDFERARKAIAWAAAIEKPSGDYEHNLRVVARGVAFRDQDAGLAASMLDAYDRAMEAARAAVESTVVGTVGKMLEVTVEVTRAQDTGGQYPGIRYYLRDETGNVLVWKSSAGGLEVGGKVRLRGKVKSHEPYVNRTTSVSTQQTTLTLCKVLETLHSPKAIAEAAAQVRFDEEERRYLERKAARKAAVAAAEEADRAAIALAVSMGQGPFTEEQHAEVEAVFARAEVLRKAAEELRHEPATCEDEAA